MRFLSEKFPKQSGILVLLLIFSWAGVRSLKVDTIWYDEWYSLYYAGAAPYYGPISVTQTIERTLQYNEYNPPGYYIILNIWGQLAGWTPFVGRALSLLFGILAIAAVYRLGLMLSQHSTAQHSTAQHSTAQHSRARRCIRLRRICILYKSTS